MTGLIANATEPRMHGLVQGANQSVQSIARFIAPLAAGILADRAAVPLVFAIGLALQALGGGYMLAFVDDPRRPGRRVLASAMTRFNEIKPW